MIGTAGWDRISSEGSPRDMGSILKSGRGDNDKSHGANCGVGGASKMSAEASGMSGFATSCT